MGGLIRTYTDKSIDWLENKRDPKKPFILYLAHTMMHTIIDASPKFRGKSKGDLYGDVVEEFDFETGRLLDKFDELGLRDNTLVIYTTDNGPWNQPKYYKRKKGHPEGSIFWGEAGPLRNGKGSPYEGGYRAPCIVRWPGRVPAGRVSDAVWATIDFLPTFANLAGYKVPTDRDIDGVDQTDLLMGRAETGRESFYFDNAGIRMGKWKYLLPKAHFFGYAVEDDRAQVDELYNLDEDIGETVNLAARHPDIVARLKQATEKIMSRKPGPPPGISLSVKKLKGRIPLKAKSQFTPAASPDIVGKDVKITVTMTAKNSDGVIVAQGGSLVGYSLYLREGRVVFGVRVNKKLKELTAERVVTDAEVTVEARLSRAGRRTLIVDGVKVEADGPALSPQPAMGLSTGQDQGANVGDYRNESFRGEIKDLVLEVR